MASHSERQVFLFGPQALTFDNTFFNKLYLHLHEASNNHWALDTVSDLSSIWGALVEIIPKLQHLDGERLLQELDQGLRTGKIPQSLFPLPNVLLSPLVVISHLTQYSAFLKAALPHLTDDEELPPSVTAHTETLGLCTGILSAFVVGCSPSLAKLRDHGAVAVRLAMIAGALVDAEEASPESDGSAISFSVSWNGADHKTSVKEVLEQFPKVIPVTSHYLDYH